METSNPNALISFIEQQAKELSELENTNQRLTETMKRKKESLERLTSHKESLSKEISDKHQQKKELKRTLELLKNSHPKSELKYDYEKALDFVQKTPETGLELLISELSSIKATLTEQTSAASHRVFKVFFKENYCMVRSSSASYKISDLIKDSALYFNLIPEDCLLKDELNCIWPHDSKVEEGKFILELKHGRLARNPHAAEIDWQKLAAHSKIESRIRLMASWANSKSRDVRKRGEKESTILGGLFFFVLYLLFVGGILYIVFRDLDVSKSYYLNTAVKEKLIGEDFPVDCSIPTGLSITYQEITQEKQFFCWFKEVLIPGIFSGDKPEELKTSRRFVLNYNQIGGIRIRQLRVAEDSCETIDYKTGEVHQRGEKKCYSEYSEETKSTQNYGPPCKDCRFSKAFKYTENIENSFRTYGELSIYDKSGFYIDSSDLLDENEVLQKETLESLIEYLETNLWIDIQTRAVIINFALYNTNYQYFTTIEIIFEIGATGVIVPTVNSDTFYTIYFYFSWQRVFDSSQDFFSKLPELYVYLYALLGVLLPIVRRIKKQKTQYFLDLWNYLDIILGICLIAVVVLRSILYRVAEGIIELVKTESFEYVLDLRTPAVILRTLLFLQSFTTLLSFLKFLNYFKIESMTMIWDTLKRGARSILAFLIVLVVLLTSFTQMGYHIYGYEVESFYTYFRSMTSMLIIMIGQIDLFSEMIDTEPYLTPFFFISYIFLIFFVLMNIFVAILNEAFGVVVEYQRNSQEKELIGRLKTKLVKELKYYCEKIKLVIRTIRMRRPGNNSLAHRAFN